jgi:putative phosphonoacetaldehyde dehydrogenase
MNVYTPEPKRFSMIIGNQRVTSPETFPITHPYTREEVGRVPIATAAQIVEALNGAHLARPYLDCEARAAILERVARHYQENLDSAALLITAESGLCIKQTRYEVRRAINALKYAARQARILNSADLTAPYRVPGEKVAADLLVVAEPVDLAVAITPFNHPLNQVVHKIAPAIAAGACVVLKPSEKTPLSAIYLAEVLIESGLPPHMLNVITGQPPAPVVKALVTHPAVQLVTFTGSVEVGKTIARMMSAGGKELVRYIPELGGNAAFVIMDDADLALAADIALGAFDNAGQRCTSIKRILLHEAVADEFIKLFLERVGRLRCGDPYDTDVDIGPVIDEEAAIRIENRVNAAIQAGAFLLMGNQRDGALYPPTVIDRVTPDMELVNRETFGPVALIIHVRALDECVEIVRAGRYRLAGAIATASEGTARRYADAIRVGQFSWNGPPGYRTENAPFGGFGDSGSGEKEGIVLATQSMLLLRTFYTHRSRSGE